MSDLVLNQEQSDTRQDTDLVVCEWEKNWKSQPVSAYINTVKSILSAPLSYFDNLKPFEDYVALVVFIAINSFIGGDASFGFQFMMDTLSHRQSDYGMPLFSFVFIFFITAFSIPMYFLFGAIMHVCFRYIGGSEKNYASTMTVYGLSTAIQVFTIFPVLGLFVAAVYGFIIQIGGQARMHKISGCRSAFAFFFPIITIYALILIFVLGIFVLVMTLKRM